MKKFAVFGGFLGAGKTTAMMALTRYCTEHGCKASMISNDLGEGVTLADHRYAVLSGCSASEMVDECICFQRENLAARLRSCFEEGCELVISDIPGFGVGALEHVYHGLTEEYPGEFALAPFTVLTEPATVELLRAGSDADRAIICHCQLLEADLIVLNKCDLPDEAAREADLDWLAEHYPQAAVLAVSARTGRGLDALAAALREKSASLRHPAIDYDGDPLQNALGRISEYYLQYHAAVCCLDFDANAYLADIAETVREAVRAAGREIPHLKLLAWEPGGDFGRVDLLGTACGTEVGRRFSGPCTELAVILNASAVCPEKELEALLGAAVRAASERCRLELQIFREQCFGLGE